MPNKKKLAMVTDSPDRRYLSWVLATLAGALVMAVGITFNSPSDGPDSQRLQSLLLMTAIICLTGTLASTMAGVPMLLSRSTRALATQLLRYGALLGTAVVLILLLAGVLGT